MTCDEVQTWVLTDETPQRPSAEVRRHVRSCAACRRSFGRVVRLIHEVETAPLTPMPIHVCEGLLANLEPRSATPVGSGLQVHATPEQPSTPAPARRFLSFNSPWVRAGAWAAAALVCLGFGLGTATLLKRGPADDSGPQARDEERDPEVPPTSVEDRVLAQHLILAEAREPARRLTALTDLAKEVREESLAQARQEKSDDVAFLVWLHGRVLHEGILKSGRQAIDRAQTLLTPVLTSLHQADQAAENLARRSPDRIAASLRQLARQARDVASALQGGADPVAPPAAAPVAVTSRSLLQVLVLTSVALAHEEDPVHRADASSQAADALTRRLSDPGVPVQTEEATRLAQSLQAVFERAVQGNLDRIDFDRIDPQRQRQLEMVQALAGDAADRMQPRVEHLPQAAQVNMLRAIEMAKQIRFSPPGKTKGPKKPKGPKR